MSSHRLNQLQLFIITPEVTDKKCVAIYQFLLTKLYLKLSSVILPPFCPGRHDDGKPPVFSYVTLNELFNKQSMYGLGNGLAHKRREVTTWTNGD